MATKRGGLGRNLSALLSQSPATFIAELPTSQLLQLSLDCLQPGQYQPRTAMDDAALQELANSIKQQGILQPIIIRALDTGRYEIIAGERRWRAARLAGLSQVPVLLKQVDDETAVAIALVENLQREELHAVDEARAMCRLIEEFNLTHQQIAELLSRSRAAVTNCLRLLSLSPEVLQLLETGDLNMGQARALLSLDFAEQVQAAHLVIAKNLSVRETEQLVNRLKKGPIVLENKAPLLDSSFDDTLGSLTALLQTKVKLKPGKSGKGSLIIAYQSERDLKKIIKQIIDKS